MDGVADGDRVKHGKLAALDSPGPHRYHVGMNPNSSGERSGISWFVSRHPGAIDWATRQRLAIERWVEHLDPTEVRSGDIVIGTLPVNLAAEVCNRGARYLHLSVATPLAWRGREMSADELLAVAAELRAFRVEDAQ